MGRISQFLGWVVSTGCFGPCPWGLPKQIGCHLLDHQGLQEHAFSKSRQQLRCLPKRLRCTGRYMTRVMRKPAFWICSDFIWPFIPPYKGVIPNQKMANIFPFWGLFSQNLKNFPKCKGKGSFPKSLIKSLICENKTADQLCGNRAVQHRYSTNPLLSSYEISIRSDCTVR